MYTKSGPKGQLTHPGALNFREESVWVGVRSVPPQPIPDSIRWKKRCAPFPLKMYVLRGLLFFTIHGMSHISHVTQGVKATLNYPIQGQLTHFSSLGAFAPFYRITLTSKGKLLHVTLKENMQQKTLSRKVGYQEFLVYLSHLKCYEKYNTSHGTILRNHVIS